jgi:hypothetical protein
MPQIKTIFGKVNKENLLHRADEKDNIYKQLIYNYLRRRCV